jgi:peroxiredoxin-like protein
MSHEFMQRAVWQGGREGTGKVSPYGQSVPLSIPAQLKGPGAGTNPEELMLASLGACYAITMGLIAARSEPAVQRIEAEVHGTVDFVTQPKRGLRFKQIRYVPHLWLAADQPRPSDEALRKLCEQAEEACFITQTVKPGVDSIVLDPPVLHEA